MVGPTVDLCEAVRDSPAGRAKLDACSERVTAMFRTVRVVTKKPLKLCVFVGGFDSVTLFCNYICFHIAVRSQIDSSLSNEYIIECSNDDGACRVPLLSRCPHAQITALPC